MTVISKQEIVNGQWWTWIITNGLDTEIAITDGQMSEEEAQEWQTKYLDIHQYDNVQRAELSIFEYSEAIKSAVMFIKTTNPTLSQWNAYLSTLPWDEVIAVRMFLVILARELASRSEIDLSTYTENEVLSKVKTWIVNSPIRRIYKVIFGTG